MRRFYLWNQGHSCLIGHSALFKLKSYEKPEIKVILFADILICHVEAGTFSKLVRKSLNCIVINDISRSGWIYRCLTKQITHLHKITRWAVLAVNPALGNPYKTVLHDLLGMVSLARPPYTKRYANSKPLIVSSLTKEVVNDWFKLQQ